MNKPNHPSGGDIRVWSLGSKGSTSLTPPCCLDYQCCWKRMLLLRKNSNGLDLEFLVCCWNASARDGVLRRFAVHTTWRYLFYAVLCLLTNPVWLNPSSEKHISESLYSSLELEKKFKVYNLCNCSQITRSISHWNTIWSLDISVTISSFPSV